jgi:hypothetical protein
LRDDVVASGALAPDMFPIWPTMSRKAKTSGSKSIS